MVFTIKKRFQQICCFIKTCEPKHFTVFLCKLRTVLSNNQLAFLFGVCKRTIANNINLAREDLHKNLVPKFINYNDRSVLITHNIPKICLIFPMIKLVVYLILPTVFYKNRKIMWDKSNCGVSRKNTTRQTYDGLFA